MSELDQDARARQLALDPARSVLLQAPAGSGKTTVLVQRFLRLLATAAEPEEILAITFTRKAAAQMRARILSVLRGESRLSGAAGDEERALAAQVRARSLARGWSLELNPGRLRIHTIDALCRSLAQQLPLLARGAGGFEVAEDPAQLYRAAARRTLADAESDEALRADADRLFVRLDHDFGRFERLLADMLKARAHWLPRLIGETADPAQLCERIEESLAAIVAARIESIEAGFAPQLRSEGAQLAREAAMHLRIEPPADSEPLEDARRRWRAIARLALTAKGDWRRNLSRRDGIPADDKQLQSRALAWLDAARNLPGALERLREAAALPPAALAEDDAQALTALSRLLQLAASELEVLFQEQGRVDYALIAGAARRALTEEGEPSDLALRVGAQVRHLLVDEFQDTSIEQFRLLEALTAGWEPGDGRTLFLVGDPMQSIYQFREAEVGLYLQARASGVGSIALESASLTRNFRAGADLIGWCNAVFPRCFPAQDDPRSGAVRFLPSTVGRSDAAPGRVALHATPPGDRAAEARAIATLIAKLRSEQPAARIAVLVSARAHAPAIAQALQEGGTALSAVDLVPLAELSVVRDLTALACAVEHLEDRVAWLATLHAPWCGLSLAELTILLEDAPQLTIWDAIGEPLRQARLPAPAAEHLRRTQAVLAWALAHRNDFDPARLLATAWLRLGGPAACASEADLVHARRFFSAFARWSAEPDWSGATQLAERMDELYAAAGNETAPAVQIMTIHAAKGLEFDHVILPSMGRKLNTGKEPLLRWLELPRPPHGSDLLMAAIPRVEHRGEDPLSEYIKLLQAQRGLHERARLAYVAATRARSGLHLFADVRLIDAAGSAHAPAKGTLLASFWPALGPEFIAQAQGLEPVSAASASTSPAPIALAERLAAGWTLPNLPPDPVRPAAAAAPRLLLDAKSAQPLPADSEARIASVVSAQLRRYARGHSLPRSGEAAIGRALRERLERLGAGAQRLEEEVRAAIALLEQSLADPRLAWIFSSAHTHSESAFELTGVEADGLARVIVDRSFIDAEGVRWLLFFRPAARASDTAELRRAQALAAAWHEAPVRGGIYYAATREFRTQAQGLSV